MHGSPRSTRLMASNDAIPKIKAEGLRVSVMAVNLSLVSSEVIRLLLGRMAGHLKHGAWCIEPEAIQVSDCGFRISSSAGNFHVLIILKTSK
jgi:hypothetical protein